jgi:hypothetical protein
VKAALGIVWTFWEGPRPAYIDLCIETMRRYNSEIRDLNRAAFTVLRQEDRLVFDDLKLNHVGDYVRAWLLNQYGGIWMDADTICLRPLAPFFAALQIADFIGYREAVNNDMQCGFMASRAAGHTIARHYALVRACIVKGGPREWLDVSSYPLNTALAKNSYQGYLQVDRRALVPVTWTAWEEFFVERDDNDHAAFFEAEAFCYALYNSCFP